ncbi:hypothetical protein Hanom_Chr09g00838161 [Helianthus anomalus]
MLKQIIKHVITHALPPSSKLYPLFVDLKPLLLPSDSNRIKAWSLLHTKQENTTQKTSLVSERAHLVYKPHIICPYNRCGTSPIPCNGISP